MSGIYDEGDLVGVLETHLASDVLTAPAYLPTAGDLISFYGEAGGKFAGVVSHHYREYDKEGRLVVLEIILEDDTFSQIIND